MIPNCPICHRTLQTTETASMFMCQRRKVYVPKLDAELDTIHCMVYLNDEGKVILKVIEVAPYAFEIHDDSAIKQTRILEVIDPNQKRGAPPVKKTRYKPARTFERETLIVIPSVVNCQWDDAQQVFDRVKMYMLFS